MIQGLFPVPLGIYEFSRELTSDEVSFCKNQKFLVLHYFGVVPIFVLGPNLVGTKTCYLWAKDVTTQPLRLESLNLRGEV